MTSSVWPSGSSMYTNTSPSPASTVSTTNSAGLNTTLPLGSIPAERRKDAEVWDEAQSMLYLTITVWHSEVLTSSVSLTWPVGLGSLGVQGFRTQWGTRLEFGFGELRQVGHHWVLVHIGIHNLLWSNHLTGKKCNVREQKPGYIVVDLWSQSWFLDDIRAIFLNPAPEATSITHFRGLPHQTHQV